MSASYTRKVFLPVLIVAFGVILFVALVKLKPKPPRQEPAQARPVVAVYTMTGDSEPVRVRGFGSVRAKRSVSLVPQVSGEVAEKSADFEAGGYVDQGQVLLKIDDTDYVLAEARAEADVAQAEYNLARAEEEAQVALREWERIGSSNAGDRDAPTALVLHEPQLKLAKATLEAARAALHQARVNLQRCTVTAPFDGRVLMADVDAGQYLRAGSSVGAIYATDIAEITVSIADDDLAWITGAGTWKGAGTETTVDVSTDFAGTRHHWTGEVVRLGGAVDARSRLVPVVVEVADPYAVSGGRPPLIEGMFVEVTFTRQPPADSVVIPRAALRPGNKVWLVDGEDHLRIRVVEVVRAGVDEAIIAGGLQAGDRIVTSNLQYVTEGLPVRIEGQPARQSKPDDSADGTGGNVRTDEKDGA